MQIFFKKTFKKLLRYLKGNKFFILTVAILLLFFFLNISYFRNCIIVLLLLFFIRDFLYRVFFIFPRTSINCKYASIIEEDYLHKWVIPEIIKSDKNIIFIGNSHVMDAVNCEIILRKTNLKGFNFAFYSVPFPNMLEAFTKLYVYPKYVFIDISTRYSTYQEFSNVDNYILKGLQMNRGKKIALLLQDLIHFLFPSLIIPKEYRGLLVRSIKKIKNYKLKGFAAIGRYTPFKLFISYNWNVVKKYNYRQVTFNGKKSKIESESEESFLKRSIAETEEYCKIGSEIYLKSFNILEETIIKLRSKGVNIFFFRLPMRKEMILHENQQYSQFFLDIINICKRNCVNYIDFTNKSHQDKLGNLIFYTDGQHMVEQSATLFSNYFADNFNKFTKND